MNGTTSIAEFREAVLDPAKRAHYRLAWLSTVDHKRIAVLYMLTALVFFIIGGVEALFMRLQLAHSRDVARPGKGMPRAL